MGLRKNHVRREKPKLHNSGLCGITDKTESSDLMENSKASFSALNLKAHEKTQNIPQEAECRKAQAIAFQVTHQMYYV